MSSNQVWDFSTLSVEQKLTLMKALKNTLGSCQGFAGLFAGFEGFIINTYVGQESLPSRVQVAVFVLFLSFAMNLFAATLALLTQVAMTKGLMRSWMNKIGTVCIFFTAAGSGLFALAFQLYISETPIYLGFKIAIWTVSTILVLVLSSIFLFFVVLTNKLRYGNEEQAEVIRGFNDS